MVSIYIIIIYDHLEKKRETEEEEKEDEVEVERRIPFAKEAHQNSQPQKQQSSYHHMWTSHNIYETTFLISTRDAYIEENIDEREKSGGNNGRWSFTSRLEDADDSRTEESGL